MLEVRALSRPALGPLSFSVERGACVFVSGPSGAGKTLLLRALADLDPHEGEVLLDGEPQERIPPAQWRRRVAYLPAEPVWWGPTVESLLPPGVDDGAFAALDLDPALRASAPERLSSGESQRLALLRLLPLKPAVLLLDEPSANLDAENTERLEALLGRLRERDGLTLLWVSHDEAQRRRLADDTLRLAGGKLQS
jgi:putative ABC transport system ATP-binding protein